MKRIRLNTTQRKELQQTNALHINTWPVKDQEYTSIDIDQTGLVIKSNDSDYPKDTRIKIENLEKFLAQKEKRTNDI